MAGKLLECYQTDFCASIFTYCTLKKKKKKNVKRSGGVWVSESIYRFPIILYTGVLITALCHWKIQPPGYIYPLLCPRIPGEAMQESGLSITRAVSANQVATNSVWHEEHGEWPPCVSYTLKSGKACCTVQAVC